MKLNENKSDQQRQRDTVRILADRDKLKNAQVWFLIKAGIIFILVSWGIFILFS